MTSPGPYEADVQRWRDEQSRLLQGGQSDLLDIGRWVGELENMGARDRREWINRLAVWIAHLPKWRYRPERRSTNGRFTIKEQRRQPALILEYSPSRARPPTFPSRAYAHGMRAAVDENGLATLPFPAEYPWHLSRLFDEAFRPNTTTRPK